MMYIDKIYDNPKDAPDIICDLNVTIYKLFIHYVYATGNYRVTYGTKQKYDELHAPNYLKITRKVVEGQ